MVARYFPVLLLCSIFLQESNPPREHDWSRYRAVVERVIDGDTIVADVYLGMGVVLDDQYFRLLGLNAPEVRGPEREQGLLSKVALSKKIGWATITIDTDDDDRGKYGRWLATLYTKDGENVNEWLIENGHAERRP